MHVLMRFKSAVLAAFLELKLYYYIPTVPRFSPPPPRVFLTDALNGRSMLHHYLHSPHPLQLLSSYIDHLLYSLHPVLSLIFPPRAQLAHQVLQMLLECNYVSSLPLSLSCSEPHPSLELLCMF